jgi:hypothetical protein
MSMWRGYEAVRGLGNGKVWQGEVPMKKISKVPNPTF